ncbi:MAG: hypothetical protein ACYC5Y_00380 [Symbiobacteriia bacterium]
MVVFVGTYQVIVQRRPVDRSKEAAREARRLDLERRVDWDRQRALVRYQQVGGGFKF